MGSAGRGRIAWDSWFLGPEVVARDVLPLPGERKGPATDTGVADGPRQQQGPQAAWDSSRR
jgi:hypothetical protein